MLVNKIITMNRRILFFMILSLLLLFMGISQAFVVPLTPTTTSSFATISINRKSFSTTRLTTTKTSTNNNKSNSFWTKISQKPLSVWKKGSSSVTSTLRQIRQQRQRVAVTKNKSNNTNRILFTKQQQQQEQQKNNAHKLFPQPRRKGILSIMATAAFMAMFGTRAWAMGGGVGGARTTPIVPMERKDIISLSAVFLGLFIVLALLHACEIAVTTLYPWKVREIAEEEVKQGKNRGTFTILNDDITRVLTTILVASTTCSIFTTTVFTHLIGNVFGTRGERYGAIALTALTLFFVELLPKSIGVTNAESVARFMVPPVNLLSLVVSPLGISLSWLAKRTLQLIGLKDKDSGSGVSDSQLRLIVTGARDSGTIDHGEQEMIQGVLDLQNQRVKEIMKPRVEMIAVPSTMNVASVLGVVRESGYSRIPVYDGEIDNIVGIVLAKSVLDFFVRGVLVDEDLIIRKIREGSFGTSSVQDDNNDELTNTISNINGDEVHLTNDNAAAVMPNDSSGGGDGINGQQQKQENDSAATTTTTNSFFAAGSFLKTTTTTTAAKNNDDEKEQDAPENLMRNITGVEFATRMQTSIREAGLIESCYFVPDTANGWSVLQEMRRRRVHMAIVVDEYGGTEGLVSLEDIVEEVVGEIYDEDDDDDYEFSEDSITLQEDGSFLIRGDADLEDCDAILSLDLAEEEALKEFATLSGFLCMCAGEIPNVGDFVMSRGWCFEVINADDKRILQVKVERLVGYFNEDNDQETDDGDNPLRGFLKRNLNSNDSTTTTTSSDDANGSTTASIDGGVDANLDGDSKDALVDNELERTRISNVEMANDVERMVEAGQKKMALLNDARGLFPLETDTSSGNKNESS